jgi:hypothetical protein
MKRFFCVIAISLCLFDVTLGQEEEIKDKSNDFQTLIKKDARISHGVYLGLEFGYANIDKHSGLLSGVNLAWVIDHSVEIGVVGKGFITYPMPNVNINNREYMYIGGYGGLHFAGTFFGSKPINISFPVTIGGGGLGYIESFTSMDYYHDYKENTFAFLLAEPGIDLQLNVTRFFRINFGVAYRYTTDLFLVDSPSDELLVGLDALRGFNYSVKFKLGRF